ncbi:MAG: hypothetical protein Q4B34_01660 [Candidatus Saccharibacteria bacterium]|nr:hypothetical protein [Candidatus Saccharibacteria bacterium]
MDNNQIPQMPQVVSAGVTAVDVPEEKDTAGLVKTIVIVVLSLALATFIGLFIWMMLQYNSARADVESEIAVAVAEAKDEQALRLETEFAEREKYPYSTFSGPADYGQLTFEYPKTWSVYVASDASKGGDYNAYFNPIQVDTVSKDTINALRLTIRNKDFESVAAEYNRALEAKDSDLKVEVIEIAGATANRYTGTIPGTELSGYIVIFKIRDKTAVLQTDSVHFAEDFDKLLTTIKFNA